MRGSVLILLIELLQVVIAHLIQLQLVLVLLDLVIQLRLQIRIVVLEAKDLLPLLEYEGLKLAYPQIQMLLVEGRWVVCKCVSFTMRCLESHLLLEYRELVHELMLSVLHLR